MTASPPIGSLPEHVQLHQHLMAFNGRLKGLGEAIHAKAACEQRPHRGARTHPIRSGREPD
eukprot:3939465-Rhodomonas_salina.1